MVAEGSQIDTVSVRGQVTQRNGDGLRRKLKGAEGNN